jgi:hypothetical protein
VLPAGNVVEFGQGVPEEFLPAEMLFVEPVFRIVGMRRVGPEMEIPEIVPEVLTIHKYYGFERHLVAPGRTKTNALALKCNCVRPVNRKNI